MADEKKKDAPKEQPKETPKEQPKGKIKVVAKYPPFIDLIKDTVIGVNPVEVEMHPWLQAQVDCGLVIVV